MIEYSDMQEVVDAITYKPEWSVDLRWPSADDRPFIQIGCQGRDSVTGVPVFWRGAKHYLSFHMCRQEIVGIAFKAIQQAEEHEMREWFRYRNRSIYNPHLDPDVLVRLIDDLGESAFIMRENAMSMEESS